MKTDSVRSSRLNLNLMSKTMIGLKQKYIYTWGNNPKRAEMKGRVCRILTRSSMNSCLVQFEGGDKEIVSRNALRKWEGEKNGNT